MLMGRHLLEMGLQPSPLIGEITRAVYEQVSESRKFSLGRHMWSSEQWGEFGGITRAYRTTRWRRVPPGRLKARRR